MSFNNGKLGQKNVQLDLNRVVSISLDYLPKSENRRRGTRTKKMHLVKSAKYCVY